MKSMRITLPMYLLSLLVMLVLLAANRAGVTAQDQAPENLNAALGTAITYQGRLSDGGTSPSGSYDFQFTLYNASSGGAVVGNIVTKEDVAVTAGLFTVQLDFGAGSFGAEARWLRVGVRPGNNTGSFTLLSPRQLLTAAPSALYSTDGPFWKLGGNTGATLGDNYLGTSDNLPLELRANGQRILRLEPSTTAPNLLGGYSGNWITTGVYGVTLFGGGLANNTGYPNRVTDHYGTVSGGLDNRAGNAAGTIDDAGYATVGGGVTNSASANRSTVAGGTNNTASGEWSTVGGGGLNTASATVSTVAGGQNNTAGGSHATISGGDTNAAGGNYATISGGQHSTANGTDSTVGGGVYNEASGNGSTVGGGGYNRANNNDSTVGGGVYNETSGEYSTVSGGASNRASGAYSTVGGGVVNVASGDFSFAAGYGANATQPGSFVWADSQNFNYDPFSYNGNGIPGGGTDTFNVRATGGVYLATGLTGTGQPNRGVFVVGGESGWNSYSDRSFKENFAAIAGTELLDRLAKVPVLSWNYLSQDPSLRHIGPMAQEFNAAFGVGVPDQNGAKKYINSLDVDGVALAGIQTLYQTNQEQAARIQALENQLARIEKAGVSSPADNPVLIWIAIAGFLALLVVAQAGMFFALRGRLDPKGGKL